jgi:gamma-glutamyltranspeptidase / glutathione hydrolase
LIFLPLDLPMHLTDYPYSSGRRVVMGQRGAVATSQPLAAIAGMEMLWAGGNAVDAAVAMAIALTVVEPTANGIGGDALALVWDGRLQGLNASGHSPQALSIADFAGLSQVPGGDWRSVTVPGAVSGWVALWQRWGRLPFAQLFAPAIRYATLGYPVSPVTALAWQAAESIYLPRSQPEFQAFNRVFFPQGRAPRAGEIWGSLDHATTLRAIADSGGTSFYEGSLAHQMANFAAATGGSLSLSDLATHRADWVAPIATTYRDATVWEMPPNTQGIATLMALNILEGIDLAQYPRESVDSYHQQIEAMKLAFADTHRYIADHRFMTVGVDSLLSKTYGCDRRTLINDQAMSIAHPGLPQGGTVYVAAADGELMVSLIQSNYTGFGSGILVPGTGIALHNRGVGFTLEAGHPNQFVARKRPFTTIIPGFLTRNGQPWGPFGVMGGPMQPQGHLQVVVNLVDYGMNPQAALDAPRWQFVRDLQVQLEAAVSPALAEGLAQRGHCLQPGHFFGRGQIILREAGVLIAASEPRADGLALAY